MRRTPEPQRQLRVWLPHLVVLAALIAAIWLLVDVVSPLFEPVLLAAALAILTGPVLCEPLNRLIARWFPGLSPGGRRKVAGIAATIALVVLGVAPLVMIVVSQAENLSELIAKVRGIVTRDKVTIDGIVAAVVAQVEEINAHYQRLKLPAEDIGESVRKFLAESSDVNTAFLSFFFAGTGTVAQIALALITLAYFNIDGPRIAWALLGYAPLTDEQRKRLIEQHRGTVLRLLSDSVATAAVKGIVLSAVVWCVDHSLGSGSLPYVPIAIVAALVSLLPLIGVTIVWLPFAGLAWTQGNYVGAIVLAIACWSADFGLGHLRERVGKRLHDRSDWLGFLLLLGIIGGLLSYGLRGLLIGPFAVVMVITIGRAWLPLYVAEPADPEPPGESA